MKRNRKKITAMLLTVAMLLMALSGCSQGEDTPEVTEEPETVEEVVEEIEQVEEPVELAPFVLAPEDLLASGLVDGIGDAAVLQGTTDIDLLDGVTYNEDIVTGVTLELLMAEGAAEETAPFDTEGELNAVYTVTLNGNALAAYLELTEDNGVELPEGEVTVEVPVTVTVISPDAAAEWLADHPDAVILTDGNEAYDPAAVAEPDPEIEETVEETPAEETPAQTDNSGTGSQPAQTGNSGGGNSGSGNGNSNKGSGSGSGNNANGGNSGNSGSGSGNSGNGGSGSGSGSGNSGSGSGNSGNSGSGSGNSGSGSGSGSGNSDNSGSGNSGNNGNSGNSGSGNNGSGDSGTSQPAHTHSWEPVYKTVHHDEVTEKRWVVDQAAWDEPIYEYRNVCNACGASFTGNADVVCDHIELEHDGGASYTNQPFEIGTKHHDEVGHYETVVVTAAWDEQVITGYKCSCGETKGA